MVQRCQLLQPDLTGTRRALSTVQAAAAAQLYRSNASEGRSSTARKQQNSTVSSCAKTGLTKSLDLDCYINLSRHGGGRDRSSRTWELYGGILSRKRTLLERKSGASGNPSYFNGHYDDNLSAACGRRWCLFEGVGSRFS